MGLGEVTTRLGNIFQWDENIVQIMKMEIRAKNVKLHDRGLIKEFFKFPSHIRPSDYQKSNFKMAMCNGRYFKLMVVNTTNVDLREEIWKGQVSQDEIDLAQKLFYHEDADLAIIASELGDLHISNLDTLEFSRSEESNFNDPISHFSELECFKRAEQNLEDDPELRRKLEAMEKNLQSSNKWTDKQLSNQFQIPNLALFRFESGACVGYDWKVQKFCEEPVEEGTNRCLKHAQEGSDLRMIRDMGSMVTKRGVSIAKGVVRIHIGPAVLDKIVEYAPSLEGAAPAFRHSRDNLEKLLEASDVTYKQGYLDKLAQFEAKEFRLRFPNAKTISNNRWKHSFLAIYEIMKTYVFDLKANWTKNVPFLLGKLGVYQGWIDAEEIMDHNKYVSARYEYKPLGTVADLLKDTLSRAKPIAPALVFDSDKMDGTSTPSTQSSDKDGICWKLNMENMTFLQVSFDTISVKILK